MFKTVIVDDDHHSINAAKEALKVHQDIEIVSTFQNSLDFFNYATKDNIDIVFLDIELNRETGFDIAKKIRKKYPSISIIFLTGHASYAVDSYDFQPTFFLTKPINAGKLDKALQIIRNKYQTTKTSQSKIMLKCRNEYKMIEIAKIDYIERFLRKNYVICQKERIQIAGYTMKELQDMFSKYGFVMCHQSYIVAISHIDSILDEKKQLYSIRIKDSKKIIPLSRNHYHEVKEMIENTSEKQI